MPVQVIISQLRVKFVPALEHTTEGSHGAIRMSGRAAAASLQSASSCASMQGSHAALHVTSASIHAHATAGTALVHS